jgi:hypothetical protein
MDEKGHFSGMIHKRMCTEVKRYCEVNKLRPKALLLIGNAPSHPDSLETVTSILPVEVVFLSPNTSLIQPIDQHVIANFKLCYLRCNFKELIEVTEGQNRHSFREFSKSYDIMKAVRTSVQSGLKCSPVAWKITEECMAGCL